MCAAESWPTAFSRTLLQPVLDDKSAVRNRARTNRKSMYPATCPASIRSVAFLHTSQLFNLCVSPSMCQLPPTSVSAVCFFGSHGIFSILRTSLFHLPCIPVVWSAVWKLPSASREGQESPRGVRFLQTRSLRGDDSWRNALLIPPNAGHKWVVWVVSQGLEKKNNVCDIFCAYA